MALTKVQELRNNADLYEALLNQEDGQVIDLCRKLLKGPLHILTIHGDTVLHMATYHSRTDLALKLLDMVPPCTYHKLTVQNHGGNTILHETGTNSKTVKVAVEMLRRAPMLLNMTNKEGETALFYAARHGKTKIFKFLHEEVSRTTECQYSRSFLRRDDRFTILHIAILSRNYWIAYQIAITYSDLILQKDADEMTPLQLLSTIEPELRPRSVFKRMIFKLMDTNLEDKGRRWEFFKNLKKEKHACEWALKLAELLISKDNSWEKTESWTDKRGSKAREYERSTSTLKQEQKIAIVQEANTQKPDTPLFLATKHDCVEIVEEILKVYPQAVEHVDKDGHNILHLAIKHRRLKIIDFVENMEYPLQRLRGRLDKKYNTLLHMVGHKEDDLKEDIKHPAQELKEDQRLYERVKKISTTVDLMTRNSDSKTPLEVFHETNDKLRSEAQQWMSENAKNCSIVAVLIATVAFTSAYTIPGGPDKSGHPVLKNRPMFLLFALADAVSLSSALTSVIIFLNIVTSPFQFKDFASGLFEKQLIALILLIVSVAMMMVSFAATLILTVSNKATWTDMSLYAVSFFPVFVFVYSYKQEYSKIIMEIYSVLRNMKDKVVMMFHEIWGYKPQSLHPVAGSVHLATRSPV